MSSPTPSRSSFRRRSGITPLPYRFWSPRGGGMLRLILVLQLILVALQLALVMGSLYLLSTR
jgi:hypothetical protein